MKAGKTGIQGHSGLIASLMPAWATQANPQHKQKNKATRLTTRQWKLTSSSVVLGLKSLLPPPGEK